MILRSTSRTLVNPILKPSSRPQPPSNLERSCRNAENHGVGHGLLPVAEFVAIVVNYSAVSVMIVTFLVGAHIRQAQVG